MHLEEQRQNLKLFQRQPPPLLYHRRGVKSQKWDIQRSAAPGSGRASGSAPRHTRRRPVRYCSVLIRHALLEARRCRQFTDLGRMMALSALSGCLILFPLASLRRGKARRYS